MRNLLKEFWYGNICPQEQGINSSSEIKKLIELKIRNRDKLFDNMVDEQRKILKKYDDCVNELHCTIERELFIYAFRLGGRFMLETLTDKENE